MNALLKIDNLHVKVEEKEIIKGLSLEIKTGEVHAIMGPNGSGKSTLAYTLMGKPGYEITKGKILFKDRDITEMAPEERAILGLFLGFQYPVAIPGVSVANFMMSALQSLSEKGEDRYKTLRKDFRKNIKKHMETLKVKEEFVRRYLNDGFSGGEKKRMEILQLLTLEPTLAILDETDSGLDIDALKVVSEGVNHYISPERAVLVITHYQRMLNYLKPHYVHILADGKIITSGGPEVAVKLETEGYQGFGLQDHSQDPTGEAKI